MPVKIITPAMRQLLHERERLSQEFNRLYERGEAIRNKIAGLDVAISILEKGDQQEPPKTDVPAVAIKELLLDFAREVGASGLNANIAVQMAEKRGIRLLRGTAASNLSRLKNDNILVHEGDRYRLLEPIRQQSGLPLTVHPGGKGS